jgi:hypothetical protein
MIMTDGTPSRETEARSRSEAGDELNISAPEAMHFVLMRAGLGHLNHNFLEEKVSMLVCSYIFEARVVVIQSLGACHCQR